jgi:hypothetical protein
MSNADIVKAVVTGIVLPAVCVVIIVIAPFAHLGLLFV